MKKITILFFLFLLVELFMSVKFYKERTLYIDPAQQLFQMVNNETFEIFVHRYSQGVNQVLPLLAIWTGMSLKTVFVLYSVSFFIIFVIIYWLLAFKWKQPIAAIAFVATLFVVRHAFVHSISETYLSVAYSALLFGWMNHYIPGEKNRKWYVYYPVMLFLFLLNYYIHPVTLFTMGAAWIWTIHSRKQWKNPHFYVLPLCMGIMFVYKLLFPGSSHEESFFSGLKKADELLPQFFSLNSVRFIKERMLRIYYIPALFYLFLAIYLAVKKKWFEWFLFSGIGIVFMLITVIIFHKGDSDLAMESRYMPLMYFAMLPLGIYVLQHSAGWRNLFFMVFLVFGIISLVQIRRVVKIYTERLHYMASLTDDALRHNAPKAVLQYNDVDAGKLYVNYGVAVETLLYSSMRGNTCTVFLTEDKNAFEYDVYTETHHFLYVPWWVYYPQKELSPKYFPLPETGYQYIGTHGVPPSDQPQ